MINVQSYLKINNEFIPIANFNGRVPDPEYIEGAIKLEVNGVKILTLEMWDNINWLWSYIAQCLKELTTQQNTSTFFPDQPIKLIFSVDSERQHVVVEVIVPQDGYVRATASYNDFMNAMTEAEQEFSQRMDEIIPKNNVE
jgi:hypothetical protein